MKLELASAPKKSAAFQALFSAALVSIYLFLQEDFTLQNYLQALFSICISI